MRVHLAMLSSNHHGSAYISRCQTIQHTLQQRLPLSTRERDRPSIVEGESEIVRVGNRALSVQGFEHEALDLFRAGQRHFWIVRGRTRFFRVGYVNC